jgi:hypothetical protein
VSRDDGACAIRADHHIGFDLHGIVIWIGNDAATDTERCVSATRVCPNRMATPDSETVLKVLRGSVGR